MAGEIDDSLDGETKAQRGDQGPASRPSPSDAPNIGTEMRNILELVIVADMTLWVTPNYFS